MLGSSMNPSTGSKEPNAWGSKNPPSLGSSKEPTKLGFFEGTQARVRGNPAPGFEEPSKLGRKGTGRRMGTRNAQLGLKDPSPGIGFEGSIAWDRRSQALRPGNEEEGERGRGRRKNF
ncbi:hypothetical protein SLEP1_g46299 [Rubroshorea leprosula]|uniref:Uncharacterized protein n=1 Tax=Rubroshorea leprosula TaxID=152421 RepID=A0AAV5LMM3_9ROSI|nr:hypothetical protein SLEP1_g46299 [Rubroshorea leprosula]